MRCWRNDHSFKAASPHTARTAYFRNRRLDGVRDEELLESALNAPFQAFGGTEAFPSIQQKAARLCYGLVKNHAFVDGNKRIGAHAMLVFLALTRIELDYTQELSDTILKIAADQYDFNDLLNWIIRHQI